MDENKTLSCITAFLYPHILLFEVATLFSSRVTIQAILNNSLKRLRRIARERVTLRNSQENFFSHIRVYPPAVSSVARPNSFHPLKPKPSGIN